jgi:hypothetical protein
MLARSFLSATDLGISEVERDALIQTLGVLERGEAKMFDMQRFCHPCGTPACIWGWASHLSGGRAFTGLMFRVPDKKRDKLFELFDLGLSLSAANPRAAQAAIALANYLTTGEPRWAEALAS